MMNTASDRLTHQWRKIYGKNQEDKLEQLFRRIEAYRESRPVPAARTGQEAKGPVYCVYPDSFQGGLPGLEKELPRLAGLGIKIIWVLPLLASPGRDQGFDISDYREVDPRYGGTDAFRHLLAAVHRHGMSLIFDIAINHSSDQHPWFTDPEYKDFHIWSADGQGFKETGHIFAGLVDSNWTWHEGRSAWYFHRFYPFQPDLNYRNPLVSLEMIDNLLYWQSMGVDGFRLDAAALIWKEEGTTCENLEGTHDLITLFRLALDAVRPGTWLLAEANSPEAILERYFGDGDECTAAFDFPLLPALWLSLARGDAEPVLAAKVARRSPKGDYFAFLRCHDELTLDLLPEKFRPEILAAFGTDSRRLFRKGQALAGRLHDMLGRNPQRTCMAFHLLYGVGSIPVLYYGDELGMLDNHAFMEQKAGETGFRDARFMNRGPFGACLPDKETSDAINECLVQLGRIWSAHADLARLEPAIEGEGPCIVSRRSLGGRCLRIEINVSSHNATFRGRVFPPWHASATVEV